MISWDDGAPDLRRLSAADGIALGAIFGTGPELARLLLACSRAAPAVGRLIHARIGELPTALSSVQAVLMGMDAAGLTVLATRAGAVRHAQALVRLLDGAALRALDAALGPEPRADALRLHAMVAGVAPPGGGGSLVEAIPREGNGCLRAWCGRQDLAVGGRVMLLLSPGVSPIGMEAVLGAAIVEALVAGI